MRYHYFVLLKASVHLEKLGTLTNFCNWIGSSLRAEIISLLVSPIKGRVFLLIGNQ